jgi:hypothetical protein
MAIKYAGHDGEHGFLKGCDAQVGKKIMCKWILTTPLIYNDNGGHDCGFDKEIIESIMDLRKLQK